MTYSVPIDYRMPYDIDGGVLKIWTATAATVTATQGQITNVNSENDTNNISITNTNGAFQIIVVFPETRTVTGYFLNMSVTPASAEYSTDTTSGLDGTWTTIGQSTIYNSSNTFRNFRTQNAITTGGNAIKAIRFSGTGTNIKLKNLHLYGKKFATSDRVEFWDPTSDVALPISAMDFGDIFSGTGSTKTFRIKNISTTKTANSIQIVANSPTVISPLLENQYTFSFDDIDYYSIIYINSLSPNTISDIIYVKRATPSNAKIGSYALRINATPSAWIQV